MSTDSRPIAEETQKLIFDQGMKAAELSMVSELIRNPYPLESEQALLWTQGFQEYVRQHSKAQPCSK